MHVRVAMQMAFGTLSNILINRPGPLEIDDDATAEEPGKAAIRYLRLEKLDPAKTKTAKASKRPESRARQERTEGRT